MLFAVVHEKERTNVVAGSIREDDRMFQGTENQFSSNSHILSRMAAARSKSSSSTA